MYYTFYISSHSSFAISDECKQFPALLCVYIGYNNNNMLINCYELPTIDNIINKLLLLYYLNIFSPVTKQQFPKRTTGDDNCEVILRYTVIVLGDSYLSEH